MEVAWPGGVRQRWVVRVGNRASEPLLLSAAKRAAITLSRERGAPQPRDWIGELNQLAANEVDRAPPSPERKQWPLEIMGAEKHPDSVRIDAKLGEAILDAELSPVADVLAEPLQGDDYPPEYYEDGYPKLPSCLARKKGGA